MNYLAIKRSDQQVIAVVAFDHLDDIITPMSIAIIEETCVSGIEISEISPRVLKFEEVKIVATLYGDGEEFEQEFYVHIIPLYK